MMIGICDDYEMVPGDAFHNCPPLPHSHLMVSPPIGVGPQGEKGEKGDKGDKGDTGEFNTPTASVDDNTGTPFIEITSTGEGDEKVFNFAFHNLKGEKFTFDDLTQADLESLRHDIASVYYRKDEATVETTGTNTSTIAIPFVDYVVNDIIFVDVNGLDLVEGQDYTISDTNIVLSSPITHAGVKVNFKRMTLVSLTPSDFSDLAGGDIADAVSDWLDDHPEATTTVQNDSVTGPKIIADGMIAELTRNLYDGYTKIDGANINSTKINSSEVGTVAFCPVTEGETYTVSKGSSSRFRLGFTETMPAVNVPIFGYYTNDAASEKTLVAPEGAAYLCVFFHNSSEDTATEAEVRATIQVEQGSTATAYVPHKTLIDFVARSGIEAAVTDFEAAMTNTFRRMGGLVSALPDWDGDWDNIRKMGIYAVTSTVSHVNAPTNDAGTLIVFNGSTTATANNRILQYFVVGTGTNRTFMRFWGGSVWQRWRELTSDNIVQPIATPPADTASVYALFDTLVTAGVATKSLIGTTSADEQLYEYVVKPSPSWGATGLVVYSDDESLYPRLKVGIMSCVHGDERGTVSYAYTLASMLAHADPRVAEIGALCEWHFLPVANPYGFDNDTRENRNGIDLNDDAENLTQDESRIIKAWMDSVSWDMFADLHQTTYGKSSGSTEAARNHCGGLVLPKPVTDTHKKRLAYAFRAISRKLASAYAYDGQHEVVWSGNTKKSWRWYAENTLHVLVWNTEISRTCYAISGSNTEQNSNALAYGCTFVYLMTCEVIKQLAAATLTE